MILSKLNNKIILGSLLLLFAIADSFGQTTTLPPAAQEAINKGIVAAKIPDYPLAVTYFQEARKTAPQSAEIFFNLGLAESNIPGRELRAICWFGAYLTANPTAANAAAVKEQINTLDVKNKSNVIRLLNMLQDVIIPQISARRWDVHDLFDLVDLWLAMSDVSAATKAAISVDKKGENAELYRNLALLRIVSAQLDVNDLEGAKKTADEISYNRQNCQVLLEIADYQLNKGDTITAQKTLAAAYKTGVKIHSDPSLGIQTMEYQEGRQLYRVAEAQARAGDIKGAQKTTESIHDPETMRGTKSMIANYEEAKTKAMDAIGVQKTLVPAQKSAELIKESYNKVVTLAAIAEGQAKTGDMVAAKKTLEAAQDTANLIQDEFYKSLSNKIISGAYEKNGIKKYFIIVDWFKKLDDSNEIDDCPLNTEPFLDLDSYLKTVASSDDPGVVVAGIKKAAEKSVKARNIVLQLLKDQAGK